MLAPHYLFAAPGLPYSIGSSATDGSSVTVSFAGGLGSTSYEYQIGASADAATATAWTALAANQNIGGLSSSTAYFFRLRGVRGMTRGPASGFGTATTGSGSSGTPIGILMSVTTP